LAVQECPVHIGQNQFDHPLPSVLIVFFPSIIAHFTASGR